MLNFTHSASEQLHGGIPRRFHARETAPGPAETKTEQEEAHTLTLVFTASFGIWNDEHSISTTFNTSWDSQEASETAGDASDTPPPDASRRV